MSVSNPRQVFSNPTIPFAGTVLGGLLPGEMILVQGSVPTDADRFQVDLTCGSSVAPRADVAFHFNPRLKKGCVVCNSLQKQRWGREQMLARSPFRGGQAFEMLLLVQEDQFKVAVNGAHLLEYKHRLDLNRVDTVCISGKVQVQAVGIIPPQSPAGPQNQNQNQNQDSQPIRPASGDLSVPFVAPLGRVLGTGHSVIIKGETKENAESFVVNLRPPGPDIALHLTPRLNKGVLVRNSFLSGCWGPEEAGLLGAFPFTAGEYFEIIILCEPQSFRVAVNGRHLLDYKLRVQDLSRVGLLEVLGDVRLLDVRVQ
ncbi:galectin-8-like [Menidia menidia]